MHGSLHKELKYADLLSDYFRFNVSLKENLKKWASVDGHFET